MRGVQQEEPSWKNSCQDLFLERERLIISGNSGFGLGTLNHSSMGTNPRIGAAEIQNFGGGEADLQKRGFILEIGTVGLTGLRE